MATQQLHEIVDPKTWTPLLQLATREVFGMMVGANLESCDLKPNDEKQEFTAMVGLAGQLCGVLTIRCSATAAAMTVSKMLGIDISQASPDSWDAIAEICNMVAGNFKSKLSGIGDRCMLSVPTVITGENYQLRSLADEEVVETVLMFEGEPIWIRLELHS